MASVRSEDSITTRIFTTFATKDELAELKTLHNQQAAQINELVSNLKVLTYEVKSLTSNIAWAIKILVGAALLAVANWVIRGGLAF
jgi:hypothetical protein